MTCGWGKGEWRESGEEGARKAGPDGKGGPGMRDRDLAAQKYDAQIGQTLNTHGEPMNIRWIFLGVPMGFPWKNTLRLHGTNIKYSWRIH